MRCQRVFGDPYGELGWRSDDLLGRRVMGLLASMDEAQVTRPFVARIGTPAGTWRWALVETCHRPAEADWHVTIHGDHTGPWTPEKRRYVDEHDVDTGLLNGMGAAVRIRQESDDHDRRVSLATLRVAAEDGSTSIAEIAAMLVAPTLNTITEAAFVARSDEVTMMIGYLDMDDPHRLIVQAEEVHELIEHDIQHIDANLAVELKVIFDAMSLMRDTESPLQSGCSGFELEFMSA